MTRRQIGKISMDDRSGDFIEHGGPLDINLRTLFHFRKPFPPRLDPCSVKRAIAPQPLPLSYTTMSWIWGGAPITGAQIDTLSAPLVTVIYQALMFQSPDQTDLRYPKRPQPLANLSSRGVNPQTSLSNRPLHPQTCYRNALLYERPMLPCAMRERGKMRIRRCVKQPRNGAIIWIIWVIHLITLASLLRIISIKLGTQR